MKSTDMNTADNTEGSVSQTHTEYKSPVITAQLNTLMGLQGQREEN